MSITNLFVFHYWFSTPQVITSSGLTVLLTVFGLMLLAGIALKSASAKGKLEKFMAKVIARWGSLALTMGGLGMLYVFVRYERVPWFSNRFWLLIWLIGGAFWAYRIIQYHRKKVPELRARHTRDAKRYAFVPKH